MPAPRFQPVPRGFLDQPQLAPGALRPGDIAVFGAAHGTPYGSTTDIGYDLATGSADAPGALRSGANESSTNIDHYDFDLGGPLMGDNTRRLVDCGDLVLTPGDGPANRAAIRSGTAALLAAGATPILLGGDDSVPIPFLAAFDGIGPVDILQIDAHIDWRDDIGGERMGYSSTMRRASELGFVRSITQVGMRGVGSARPAEVADALGWGARLITVAEARDIGPSGVLAAIPSGGNLLIHIDCDALDPSVCPAVNAPTPGGFQYDELAALLRTVIAERPTAGASIVELAPAHDLNAISAITAARLVCNIIGAIARRPS